MINKNRGFTLVELLAIIVILSILLVLAGTNISKMVDNIRLDIFMKREASLIEATKSYLSLERIAMPTAIGNAIEVTISELQEKNFVGPIKDHRDNKSECRGYVLVTKTSATDYDYTSHLRCGAEISIENSTDDQLLGYWKLNGNALDYSVNNNHGTVIGASLSSDRFGIANNAYNFNYTTDRIELGNSPNNRVVGAVSISAWINTRDVSRSQNIVSRNGPYFLRIVGSRLRVGIYTGTWIFVGGNIVLNNDTWYNLVLTYDGIHVKGYVNGVLDISSPKTGNLTAWSNLFIGYTTTGGEQAPFDGKLDDIRIYGRALSENEIKSYYEVNK